MKGKEIKSFDFNFIKSEDHNYNPHLAVTLNDLEGAASGFNTALILKSEDTQSIDKEQVLTAFNKAKSEVLTDCSITKALVNVQLPFQDFLAKFFDMYSSDADLLATMLGMYENTVDIGSKAETYEDYLIERASTVKIIKAIANKSTAFEELSTDDKLKVIDLQKNFESYLSKESTADNSVTSVDSKPVQQTDVTTINKGKDNMENIQELLKSAEMQELLKSVKEEAVTELQKAAEAEKQELNGKIDELLKAKSDAEAYAEKVKIDSETEKASELVKSLSFVDADSQEDLIKSLVANRNAEGIDSIVKALSTAKDAVEAVALTKATTAPEGTEKEADIQSEDEVSGLMKAIKAKKENK